MLPMWPKGPRALCWEGVLPPWLTAGSQCPPLAEGLRGSQRFQCGLEPSLGRSDLVKF